jgi:hypothetical protein
VLGRLFGILLLLIPYRAVSTGMISILEVRIINWWLSEEDLLRRIR